MAAAPGPREDAAFSEWVSRYKAPPWKAPRLQALKADLKAAAQESFRPLNEPPGSSVVQCTVHLEGSFARGTSVWDSDGDYVVVAKNGAAPHMMSRQDRVRLHDKIQMRLKKAGIAVLSSGIGTNAVSFTLRLPEGELSFDVVADSTRFSRPASADDLNPFSGQPGAVDAARALKVLMRKCPGDFPAISGTFAEALVLSQLRRVGGGTGRPAGALHLFVLVLQMFKRDHLQVPLLDQCLRPCVPYNFKNVMNQGQIECWCNHAQNLLKRCPHLPALSSSNAVHGWVLGGAVLPPAPQAPILATQPSGGVVRASSTLGAAPRVTPPAAPSEQQQPPQPPPQQQKKQQEQRKQHEQQQTSLLSGFASLLAGISRSITGVPTPSSQQPLLGSSAPRVGPKQAQPASAAPLQRSQKVANGTCSASPLSARPAAVVRGQPSSTGASKAATAGSTGVPGTGARQLHSLGTPSIAAYTSSVGPGKTSGRTGRTNDAAFGGVVAQLSALDLLMRGQPRARQ